MTTATQAEFARLKGVSRAAVTEWKNQDRLVMSGNLIDVEMSQEKLLRGSGHRAKGRRADVKLLTDVAAPPVPGPVISLAMLALGIGLDTAEAVLRRGVDEMTARHVADDVTAKAVRAAIDLVHDEHAPPIGYARWDAHPIFNGTPSHRSPSDWSEMAADVTLETPTRAPTKPRNVAPKPGHQPAIKRQRAGK